MSPIVNYNDLMPKTERKSSGENVVNFMLLPLEESKMNIPILLTCFT